MSGCFGGLREWLTGALYEGGRRSGRMEVGRERHVATHEPEHLTEEAHVELRLVGLDREVLAADAATWRPEGLDDAPVAVSLAEAAARLPAGTEAVPLELELVVDGERVARQPLQMR